LVTFTDYLTSIDKTVALAASPAETIGQALQQELDTLTPFSFPIDKNRNFTTLRLGTFVSRRIKYFSGISLRRAIKSSFRKLYRAGVENLIVDVRGYTGGKSFAAPLLFSYLTDVDFKFKRKIVFRHGHRFTYSQYLNRNKFSD
jgi:hypothetical protein